MREAGGARVQRKRRNAGGTYEGAESLARKRGRRSEREKRARSVPWDEGEWEWEAKWRRVLVSREASPARGSTEEGEEGRDRGSELATWRHLGFRFG